MNLEQIRKLCQEVQAKYDINHDSVYHEDRKGHAVSVYLTLKFKVDLNHEKKLLDKT